MKRRTFLTLAAAGLAMRGPIAFGSEAVHVAYSRDAYDQAIADGKPLLLDFYASW